MEQAIARVPALETAGIKQMINGPESFTPDGNFILGEAPEVRQLLSSAPASTRSASRRGAAPAGPSPNGSMKRRTADRPVGGRHPSLRRPAPRSRLGARPHARSLRQALHGRLPARGIRERPATHRVAAVRSAQGARRVFGSKLGWERANWFAPAGTEPRDVYSMGRQNWFDAVGDEHRARSRAVGVFDQSSFAKFELVGSDAGRALDWICANNVDKPAGPSHLHADAQFARRHRVRSHRRAARRRPFYIVTGTGFRTHDLAWIARAHPCRRDARLIDVTEDCGTLVADGPARARRARRRHRRPTSRNAAFPFGHVRDPGDRRATTCARCASPMSANSAGSCTSRSPRRAPCSMR